ncbi:MAG: hypothetical protein GX361_02745 [Bacteroidales bacterium]|nr:hypothetical protein [Bacteroidales bacterium]
MKKLLLKSTIVLMTVLAAISFTSCGIYESVPASSVTVYDYSYNNPMWAPPYYPGTRYYYFPDIECYYDLATRDFIVLNMGEWMFVPSIAPFYSTYDLYNSYIVIVNTRVYQPWMHHHYYVRSYPRYYYIDYYDYSNIPYVRGFNENKKGAIYWGEKERHKARPWDDRNIRSNRKFTYSNADRRVQQETTRRVNQERRATLDRTGRTSSRTAVGTTSTRTRQPSTTTTRTTTPRRDARVGTTTRSTTQSSTPTKRTQTTRRSSRTNYYGNDIGTPVRVQPQMRRSDNSSTRSSRADSEATRTRSNTSRRR